VTIYVCKWKKCRDRGKEFESVDSEVSWKESGGPVRCDVCKSIVFWVRKLYTRQPMSKEQKLRISEALKGKPLSPETRLKISLATRGKRKPRKLPSNLTF